MALKLYRGLDSDRLTFIPQEGEPIWSTDTKKLYMGDGVTYGGVIVTYEQAEGSQVDSEWVLRVGIEAGSLSSFDMLSPLVTSNFVGTDSSRTNSGSTNPNIETTINEAVVDDLVEYEEIGAY